MPPALQLRQAPSETRTVEEFYIHGFFEQAKNIKMLI
jgi:hypothetical protein